MSTYGEFTEAIVREIATSPLCIVVLTFQNPNVMYELGLRQAWCLPSIPLAEKDTVLPSDVRNINTIFYSLSKAADIKIAVASLKERVNNDLAVSGAATVFQETISAIGDRYSLDAVFKSKGYVLMNLCDALRLVKGELETDYELQRSDPESNPLKPFANQSENIFQRLRDQVHTLEFIANVQTNTSAPQADCLNIIDQIKKIQTQGVQLCKSLSVGKHDQQSVDNITARIDRIIKMAESTRKLCDPARLTH